MLTYDQLYYFCEVYCLKSITTAAENLHVSRQAVSLMINKIEKENNVTLFTRKNNKLIPNSFADDFYRHARIILDDYNAINTLIQHNQSATEEPPLHRTLIFGVPESFVSQYGETFVTFLRTRYPYQSFRFIHTEFLTQEELSEMDVVICITRKKSIPNYQKRFSMDFKIIKPIPCYVWAHKTFFSSARQITLKQLKKEKFCCVAHAYNAETLMSTLGLNNRDNKLNLPFQESVVDYVTNHGYLAIDIKLLQSLLYSEAFNSKPDVILHPVNIALQLAIGYKSFVDFEFIESVFKFFSDVVV